MPKLFVATKAFVKHGDRVLILRESSKYSDGANAGRWDVPGGRLEPGQRFLESLRREVREETGLAAEPGLPFHVGEWRPTVRGEEWQIVGIYFECRADSEAVVLSEDHDSFEWIRPEDFRKYGLIPNLESAFEAYLARPRA